MSSPIANFESISDEFKEKITSLIKEQLKRIVTELAAQEKTLLSNLALLRHNHNVNDYQTTRLENIRDLEQSVNYKVSGALGFDPSQHPTMGTNLREPVPADPELTPKFMPLDQATPAERAAQSAALIEEAGISARQIGVPLTLQDFPDHPSMKSGAKKEDPMHASIPLFGLRAPRWRAKQGLDEHTNPGTAVYDGVVAPSIGGVGLRLFNNCERELMPPRYNLIEQGGNPRGIRVASSSSSPDTGTGNSSGVQGMPAGASSSDTPRQIPAARVPTTTGTTSSTALSARPRPPLRRTYAVANLLDPPSPQRLRRTYAIANMEDTISTSTPPSNINPKPSGLRRTSTMATIESTRSEGSTYSSFSKISTTATVGSEPPQPPPPPPSSSSHTTAKNKTKNKAKAKQSTSKQRSAKTAAPTAPTPIPTSTSSTTLKRGRRTAELEDAAAADDDMITDEKKKKEEEEEEGAAGGPSSKRRKRSAASDTSIESTTTTSVGNEDETGQTRRPTRRTRASTAAPQSLPAPRGRATKGKKANGRR